MQVKHTPFGAADWKVYTRDSRPADAADAPDRAAAGPPAPSGGPSDTVSLASVQSAAPQPADTPQVVRYTREDAAGWPPSPQATRSAAASSDHVPATDGIADFDGARKIATYVKNQIMANAGQALQAQASNYPNATLPLPRV